MPSRAGIPNYGGTLTETDPEPPIDTKLQGGAMADGDCIEFTRVAVGTDSDWLEIINNDAIHATRVGWATVRFWLPLRIVERPGGYPR